MLRSESKKLLASSSLLVHYDPKLPLILACDASAYGIGAVLAHRMPDGSEKPIGYASRTLNKAEKNYSQLEKEGLSLVFGIKKFYPLCVWSFIRVGDRSQTPTGIAGRSPFNFSPGLCSSQEMVSLPLHV